MLFTMQSIGSSFLLLDLCIWLLLSPSRYFLSPLIYFSPSKSIHKTLLSLYTFSLYIYTHIYHFNFILVLLILNMMAMAEFDYKEKRKKFCINDHIDVLIEILKRLDGRSLGVAASVCRLWCSVTRNDSLWEHLCFRHVSPPPSGVRPVVVALGGYRKLYMVCVRPVLSRLGRRRLGSGGDSVESELVRRVWTRHEVEMSLSLFCVDYYERLMLGGGGAGRVGGDAAASSLMFLCKAVNV